MSGITNNNLPVTPKNPNIPDKPSPMWLGPLERIIEKISDMFFGGEEFSFPALMGPIGRDKPPGLDHCEMRDPLRYVAAPNLNVQQLGSLMLTSSTFYKLLQPIYVQKAAAREAAKVSLNWQTVLQKGSLINEEGTRDRLIENDEEVNYLNDKEFVDALTNYLINTNQDLDSFTSDLLEIPNLAQDLGLRPEMEEKFQSHLNALKAKKDRDLWTFWEEVSSQIDGVEPDDLNLEAGETLESALTKLLEQHQEGIERLRLYGKRLAFLPKGIEHLSQLKELNLEHNDLIEIPQSIGNLKQLKNLFLTNNLLTEIPQSIGNLTQLEHLFLSGNPLTEIPQSIKNLKQLLLIDLRCDYLTQTLEEMRAFLPHCMGFLLSRV